MSSAQVQRPVKVENPEDRNASKNRARLNENVRANRKSATNITGHFPKKHKYENDGRNKFGRKRAQSFTVGGGKFFPPYKRRKKEGTIIPPTKFLLGGNIYDPLNLNSLQDEEINRAMNAVTPKSSPLPTPRHRKGEIEVIIPPNLHDPLNLISCEDDAEYEQQLVSPTKRGRKSRKKKKRNSSSGGSSKEDGIEGILPAMTIEGGKTGEEEKDISLTENVSDITPESLQDHPVKRELNLDLPLKEKDKKGRKSTEDAGGGGKDCKPEKKRKIDLKDKIVSPVIPQPGAWKRPLQYSHRGGGNMPRGEGPAAQGRFNRHRPMPKFNKKQEYFQYGNYLRYYGYRNPQHEEDVRVKFIEKRKELFQDKDVLDIGCNIGHVTMLVARDFGARSVVGLDIDRKLINIARKNVRHYVNFAASPPNDETRGAGDSKFFPISMPILFGPVDIPGISHGQSPSASKKFPHNVTFVQGNYVLDSDALLATEQPQFDVILCLSITKWLHLNWGDSGLKQAFRRMYLQLRPGGYLILEPQAWESYKRKKNLTETIFKNYNTIEFYPQKFTEYLLSTEVGFTQCEVIGTPFHNSKGFQRPIQLFTKGEISPARSAASNTNTPSHTIVSGASRPRVYAAVSISSREVDDDETSVQDCAIETANEVPMEIEESKKVELNFVSSRSCDDDFQESDMKPDIESKESCSVPLNVESVPNVRLSVIRKVEKGIEHESASSVKLEVDVLVPEKMEESDGVIVKVERERVEGNAVDSTDKEMKTSFNENKMSDVKNIKNIDGTVSESTNEQERITKVESESDMVQSEEHCITESVKMSSNKT